MSQEHKDALQQFQLAAKTRNGIYHVLVNLLSFAENNLPRLASWRQFWPRYCADLKLPPSGLESNWQLFLDAEHRAATDKAQNRPAVNAAFQILLHKHLTHETTTAQDVLDAIDSVFGFVADAIHACEDDRRYRDVVRKWKEYGRAAHCMNSLLAQECTGWRLQPLLPHAEYGKVRMQHLTSEQAGQESMRTAKREFDALVRRFEQMAGRRTEDHDDVTNDRLLAEARERAADEHLIEAGEARIKDGQIILTEQALSDIRPFLDLVKQQTGKDLSPMLLNLARMALKQHGKDEREEMQARDLMDEFFSILLQHEIQPGLAWLDREPSTNPFGIQNKHIGGAAASTSRAGMDANKKGTNGTSGKEKIKIAALTSKNPGKCAQNSQKQMQKNAEKCEKIPKKCKKIPKNTRPIGVKGKVAKGRKPPARPGQGRQPPHGPAISVRSLGAPPSPQQPTTETDAG